MFQALKNYIETCEEYDSSNEEWDDYMERIRQSLRATCAERGVSDISIGDYCDDSNNVYDVADCMLSFAKYHKVLDYAIYFSDRYDTTFVAIKYANTLD